MASTKTHSKKVPLPPNFDVSSYINSYTGHARVSVLCFLAENVDGVESQCYETLISDFQKCGDTKGYKTIMDRLLKQADANWIREADKDANAIKEQLDAALNVAKTNLIKDDIRACHNGLGDFYYNRNDLSSALKCYVRTRDYCTTSGHIVDMCLNVIRTCVDMGNYSQVMNYVQKAEQTPDLTARPVVVAQLAVAAGLSHLNGRKYKLAARSFLDAAGSLGGNTFSDVASLADVSLYAGACALATFDRPELKRLVINNPKFKTAMGHVPEMAALIDAFYNCKYTNALSLLALIRGRLVIDHHIAEHATVLCSHIRNKAIVQFFTPYSCVDIVMMAEAFGTDVAGMELELKNLIVEDAIQARIDSFNKVLVAKKVDQRTQMFRKATEVGQLYQDNTRDMLLRMNLVMNDFAVKPLRAGGGRDDGRGKKLFK